MQTRREFLQLTGNYITLAGLSSFLSPALLFGDEIEFSDYKALVIILQHGGNDSLNMLVPSGDDSVKGYENYATIRNELKVHNIDLTPNLVKESGKLILGAGEENPYYENGLLSEAYTKGFYKHSNIDGLATNAVMPEFANLVNEGDVAMVANVGTLIQPTTKEEIENKTASLPPFLFSHNSQRRLIFNGAFSTLNGNGWAGLLADKWLPVNNGSLYGMNISLSGVSSMLYGKTTEPLMLNPKKPPQYNKSLNREVYDKLLDDVPEGIFPSLYNTKRKHSFLMQDVLLDDWTNKAPVLNSTNSYGEELFSLPTNSTLGIATDEKIATNLLTDMKAVATLAHIGKNKGLRREIFYVMQGGYDTHSGQKDKHSSLLRELSISLGDLQTALKEMGMQDEVTTFNISDFGRSTGSNGDGTDHAWGGHHFVMGGAVKGGLYGKLPDLTLNGVDDAGKKGRMIPTTSSAQYLGTIVKWFGADDATVSSIFPDIKNFDVSDLGFMEG